MDSEIIQPIFICGPTASGKSSLAIEIAKEMNGEIVNADAFQLYKGLEIISAAPSPDDYQGIPHHLYGVLEPTTSSDAGHYTRLALPIIRDIQQRGKYPIVTGGSGLYLKFLTHGPAPLPTADPILRNQMDALSLEELVSQLQALDPVEASRTALKNRRFVSRALEICLLTGQKASDLRDQWQSQTEAITGKLRGKIIQRPRHELHKRIAIRTRLMLDHGAIDEIAAMKQMAPNCEKAIGVREIRAFLSGDGDMETCEAKINAATRQYAKRQESWFKRETWLIPA
jgi:tRNA dimethylallyltransferase